MPGFLPMMQQLGAANFGGRSGGPGAMRRNNQTDRDTTLLDMNPDHTPNILMQPGEGDGMIGVEQANMDSPQNGFPHPPRDRSRARQSEVGGLGEGHSNGSTSQIVGPKGRESMKNGRGDSSKHAGVTTIVVEKIPPAHVSEEAVTSYFQQFGTITNVVVDRRTKQALVTFAEKHEASKAVRSPDAPWGNKYAKVFWHNPMYGGAAGAKVVAGSAPVNPSERPQPAKPPAPSLVLKAPIKSSPASTHPPKDPAILKRKLLLEEQKALLTEAATATPERKKEIIAKIRDINKQMTELPTATDKPPSVSAPPKDATALERERLDAELDLVAPAVADTTEGENGGSNYEALKARLESLRAEVRYGFIMPPRRKA